MSWIIYALGAISANAFSDLFRKLGSALNDPFLSNLIFQSGAFLTSIILFLLFSRKYEGNPQFIFYAFIGGVLISIFTTLSFKALHVGPGVSTVMPIIRVGAVVLVALLGILILREKFTWNIAAGVTLACAGVYLLFTHQ
jgi:uncharacterized membrane protein